MPKHELYVIFTGNKSRKANKISLLKEFFEGDGIDIEIKEKTLLMLQSGKISGDG